VRPEAAQWLKRALELREAHPGCDLDAARLAALYEDLGDAHFESGHVDQAIETLENALRACPDASPTEAGRRYRKLGSALVLTPQVARATLAYLDAERVMGEPTPDKPDEWWAEWLAVELERCWGHYYAAEFDGLTELAERIRPFVDAHGSAAHRGALYDCLQIGDEGISRYVTSERGLEYAHKCEVAYRDDGGPRERCNGRCVLSLALLWLPDHPDEARIQLRQYLRLAEECGEVVHQLEALFGLAMWHRWHGHVGEVRELAERSLALNSGKNLGCYTPCAQGNLAWIAYRDGELESARELASEALATIERDEEHVMAFQWQMRWPLLGIALRSGDLDEATTQAKSMLREDQQAMPGPLEAALADFLAASTVVAAEPALLLAREQGYL
jgi:tetratricopeptide (TPR) repeat protein